MPITKAKKYEEDSKEHPENFISEKLLNRRRNGKRKELGSQKNFFFNFSKIDFWGFLEA
jgi:hypothetical protein